MDPGWFSWFQVDFHGFSLFQVGFSWFEVGFHGSRLVLHGFSWFFSKMYLPELYPGPTIQSRSAARRAAQDLVLIKCVHALYATLQTNCNFEKPKTTGKNQSNICQERRQHLLGTVITGNASAEINQCPLAKTSPLPQACPSANVWRSMLNRTSTKIQRLLKLFTPAIRTLSEEWMWRAGLNGLIPRPPSVWSALIGPMSATSPTAARPPVISG